METRSASTSRQTRALSNAEEALKENGLAALAGALRRHKGTAQMAQAANRHEITSCSGKVSSPPGPCQRDVRELVTGDIPARQPVRGAFVIAEHYLVNCRPVPSLKKIECGPAVYPRMMSGLAIVI